MPDPRLEAAKKRAAEAAAAKTAQPAAAAPKSEDYGIPALPSFTHPKPPQAPPKQEESPAGTLSRWGHNIVDATKHFVTETLPREGYGALHAANQLATAGYADEIGGTLAHALGLTPGRTADQAREDSRHTAEKAIREARVGAPLGALAASIPAAMATGGLSAGEQALASLGLLTATRSGQATGGPAERYAQTTAETIDHPIATAAETAAPYAAHGAGKAFDAAANWLGDARLGTLGRLITTPAQRAKLRATRGGDAVTNLARRADNAGLFKGSNPISDFIKPVTARRVADNVEKTIETVGPEIGDVSRSLKEKAAVGGTAQNQQADWGPLIKDFEALRDARKPSAASASEGEKSAVQREIDYIKEKTQRSGNSPKSSPEAINGSYEPPAQARDAASSSEPVDVPSERVHPAAEYSAPRETVHAENVSDVDGKVVREGANRLESSTRTADDLLNASMPGKPKALPKDTAGPNPDELYSSPKNASDAAPVEDWAKERQANLATRGSSELTRMPEDAPSTALAKRGTDGLKAPATQLAARTPEMTAGSKQGPDSGAKNASYPEDAPVDAEFSDPSTWTPITPPAPPAKQLGTGGAPKYSMSLADSLDAQADAAHRASFDPQVQKTTTVGKQMDLARWQGLKDANREGISRLGLEDPSVLPDAQRLNDLNEKFHVAKSVQMPALQQAERDANHAFGPRDILYGALNGHGVAVAGARFAKGGIPGSIAKIAGAGEQMARASKDAAGFARAAGLPVTGGSMEETLRDKQEPPGLLDRAKNAAEGAGKSFYDWFHSSANPSSGGRGLTVESVAEKNSRMSEALRARLENGQ